MRRTERSEGFALLVVDMQGAFCERSGPFAEFGLPVERFASVIPTVAALLQSARENAVSVFFTRLVYRADRVDVPRAVLEIQAPLLESNALSAGSPHAEIVTALEPGDGEVVVDKQYANSFHRTRLQRLLNDYGTTELTVAGLTTGVCVSSTARAASELGYRVTVAADATAERNDLLHQASLELFAQAFGFVQDSEDVMERWMGARTNAQGRLA